jgi:two-component system chemotaxis sensor kinase CheA
VIGDSGEGRLPNAMLDEYAVECEEHLTAVRESLARLEHELDQAVRARLLEEVFRGYHSIKGLSAMVELNDGERLAHALEECLRNVRQGQPLTTALLEALNAGTTQLEALIAAFHRNDPLPSIDAVLFQLPQTSAPSRSVSGGSEEPGSATPASSATAWIVTFVPSPSLIERGIKVDVVRGRLTRIGRIVRATPQVTSDGAVAFEFRIEVADAAAFDEAWREDGMTWMPAPQEPEPAGESQPSGVDGGGSAHPGSGVLAPAHVVRVDLPRLDALMQRVADLVITRARLDDVITRVERHLPVAEWRALREHEQTLERYLRDLREDVMRIRMVRVDEIFRRMPFIVRDLARDGGKEVTLEMSGQRTEIDKFLVDRLMEPLLHLVRNAVSHGIEPPAARRAAGKPLQGTIRLSAATVGDMVSLAIEDDGAGVDVAAIRQRAMAMGLPDPGADLNDEQVLDLIAHPGLSTRDEADRASGRGVGMAAVRAAVHELGGRLSLKSELGRGTSFSLELPVTLTITGALIASIGPETFAVPQGVVGEVVEIEAAAIRPMERHELVVYRGRALPLIRLDAFFGLPRSERSRLHAFVVGSGEDAIALVVDRIVGHREVVVRTFTDPLVKTVGISGATELGDGRLILILDVLALSRHARGRTPASATPFRSPAASRRALA